MRHEPIDVREFRAKGDGVADDTAAINAAFDEMRQNSIVLDVPIYWGGAEWMPGTCPSLVFPCGHYRISDEINISGNFEALGKRDNSARARRVHTSGFPQGRGRMKQRG